LCIAWDSLKRVGQPGPLTRLMSCSEEQLKDYKWLELLPTYVAPNLAHDTVHDDWYQPYNKPTAVHYWLRVSPARLCTQGSLLLAVLSAVRLLAIQIWILMELP
jgi:hypothetical protein